MLSANRHYVVFVCFLAILKMCLGASGSLGQWFSCFPMPEILWRVCLKDRFLSSDPAGLSDQEISTQHPPDTEHFGTMLERD